MLDPVIEEEEGYENEQRNGLEQTTLEAEDPSKSIPFADRERAELIELTVIDSSAGTIHEQADLVRRPSIAPPPDPKRLSEEALLHALHNIRIEEEEELSFRRKSLHIVEIPATVLPPPQREAADKPRVPDTEAQSIADEKTPEVVAPYAGCSVYQLACSRERLRDMEQQLQNAVCMMQDTVELVARRLRESKKDGSGEEGAENVVDSMRDQLNRLVGAHERVSLEHGLVAREMEARPGNLWEEMARRIDFHANKPETHRV
ncbi:hypothetical protein F5X68DRAFT_233456 [Plectosphaerella plurivora]|uniref:Uncharacterized protein n=1 Tax=Plectosphaerella plurivora TaxID=936078 RepID=A0A9P8VA60_9PEZI|nr:hypothetical protein F5X68DRAFT_233456 [Plectosphaerella plurivora]